MIGATKKSQMMTSGKTRSKNKVEVVTQVNTLPGYESVLPIYKVSNSGKIYSDSKAKNGKPLKQNANERGYHLVGLRTYEGKYLNALVHRLIALAFVQGYQPMLQVDHRDGNKDNNVPDNLIWSTPKENTHNPKTFEKFIEKNRISHNSKLFEVTDTSTGVITVYPSSCSAARAIGYKSNSIYISETKGYRQVGKYIVREVVL